MAYTKQKKKKIWTKQDQDWVDKMLSASKKWAKPYKGEIVFKQDGSCQECVLRARYASKEELLADAEKTIADMNTLDKEKTWSLISAKLVGQVVDDEEIE